MSSPMDLVHLDHRYAALMESLPTDPEMRHALDGVDLRKVRAWLVDPESQPRPRYDGWTRVHLLAVLERTWWGQ